MMTAYASVVLGPGLSVPAVLRNCTRGVSKA